MQSKDVGGAGSAQPVEWVVTTQAAVWQAQQPLQPTALDLMPDVMVRPDAVGETIDGIGCCFNELGWTALEILTKDEREMILHDLFGPGVGTNFTPCRMPIGANDFSRNWYSYDETDGDFDLQDFSIAQDNQTLVRFIKAAQRHQARLRLWASPWSPPTWMKVNRRYAGALPWPGTGVENGLQPDQVGREATDMFILEDGYLHAYARCFALFVEAYRPRASMSKW